LDSEGVGVREKKLRIGFMQGRLSPLIDGKIQAFPWPYWEAEFPLAASVGLSCMEWTLDQDRISANPLMTESGRAMIHRLSTESGIRIPSLTGDCFLQAPFWKASGRDKDELIATFEKILLACSTAGIRFIVVPLVDNGSLTSAEERVLLENTLLGFVPLLQEHDLVVALESDFSPRQLTAFIAGLPADRFGINFDTGNSASLGWDPEEEIGLLASRIVNVHVKDRILGGTTVPLGHGAANLPKVFALLRAIKYDGNFILQTARAADGEHVESIRRYYEFVAEHTGRLHGS
jgi:hexulose-6-phosphate isomerase